MARSRSKNRSRTTKRSRTKRSRSSRTKRSRSSRTARNVRRSFRRGPSKRSARYRSDGSGEDLTYHYVWTVTAPKYIEKAEGDVVAEIVISCKKLNNAWNQYQFGQHWNNFIRLFTPVQGSDDSYLKYELVYPIFGFPPNPVEPSNDTVSMTVKADSDIPPDFRKQTIDRVKAVLKFSDWDGFESWTENFEETDESSKIGQNILVIAPEPASDDGEPP